MTRGEKQIEARRLREQGTEYREIAERLNVGLATVYRWCNPSSAERERRYRRFYRSNNREYLAADRKRYRLAYERVPCPRCKGQMEKDATECRDCRRRRRHVRGHLIERWWGEGLTMATICSRLGWSQSHLGAEMAWLRGAGFDLPYRNPHRQPKHPELRAEARAA